MSNVHIALANPKFPHNVGAAIRAMSCFTTGGDLVFTGDRVKPETMSRIPREERMKAYADVNWRKVTKPTEEFPDHTPVAIELVPGSQSLHLFEHPKKALYIFGPEDGSIDKGIRAACHAFVTIPSKHCLNLSCAVNVVLWDRLFKEWQNTGAPMPHLQEQRGVDEALGWAVNDFDLVKV